jgi:nucleoside-diphosphate-sugar epimerase
MPVDDKTALIKTKGGTAPPPYTEAKLRAEARHRKLKHHSVLDVRVFGYAAETLDISGNFFLAELARSIVMRTPFSTSPNEMVRDYAGPDELLALIRTWADHGAPNCAVDLYTREPTGKNALLEIAADRYGLKVVRAAGTGSASGSKPFYASMSTAANSLGYFPVRTSTEILLSTLDAIYIKAVQTRATGGRTMLSADG